MLAAKPRDETALTDVFRKLQWLLRTDPEAMAQVGPFLDYADAAAADIVLSAAGAAGTEAAQALLCDVLDSPVRSAALRDSALNSMFQLAEPGERAVAAVRGLLHTGGGGQRDTSLLLLGAFGSTSKRASQGAKSRDELVAELIAFEDEARRQGRLAHWLAALGNTAHPAALAAARPYLGSQDADLRDRAVAAIGSIQTSDATAALLEHAGRERDLDIRCRTVALLAARDDVRAHRFTADLLAREPSEVVRRAAIQGLARRPDEAARQLLRQVVAGDASPELQRLAGEILAR